ncbi:hypothetical protein [Ramlibacter agri]|uniref:hypothetical protein n=1 Tax=Ramlibacter agri TaxID=2728837 RepID=UPI001F103E3A|nr:hypothetical protein [Ramlibacter agri]
MRWRLLGLALLLPVAAWFLVKPVRVLAPTLVGVTCVRSNVCVDDLARSGDAQALYDEAVAFVSARLAPMDRPPRIVFCWTQRCAEAFGLGDRAAVMMGTWGAVIGPRAWTYWIVRHELIHYVQARHLNALAMLLKPRWLVEGMAYALSEDPRQPLAEPWESDRRRFLAWYAHVGPERMWEEARRLRRLAPNRGS